MLFAVFLHVYHMFFMTHGPVILQGVLFMFSVDLLFLIQFDYAYGL